MSVHNSTSKQLTHTHEHSRTHSHSHTYIHTHTHSHSRTDTNIHVKIANWSLLSLEKELELLCIDDRVVWACVVVVLPATVVLIAHFNILARIAFRQAILHPLCPFLRTYGTQRNGISEKERNREREREWEGNGVRKKEIETVWEGNWVRRNEWEGMSEKERNSKHRHIAIAWGVINHKGYTCICAKPTSAVPDP